MTSAPKALHFLLPFIQYICLRNHLSRDDMLQLHQPNINIYSKASAAAALTDANAFGGGSMRKSNELKAMMNMVNMNSDLQESPYFLTSLSPSS